MVQSHNQLAWLHVTTGFHTTGNQHRLRGHCKQTDGGIAREQGWQGDTRRGGRRWVGGMCTRRRTRTQKQAGYASLQSVPVHGGVGKRGTGYQVLFGLAVALCRLARWCEVCLGCGGGSERQARPQRSGLDHQRHLHTHNHTVTTP